MMSLTWGSCFVDVLLFKVLRGVLPDCDKNFTAYKYNKKGVASSRGFLCFFVLFLNCGGELQF